MWVAPHLKDEDGLSLIEFLIMILLVSLILISIPASFRSATHVWEKSRRHNEVLQNALVGMEELARELRQAKNIRAVSLPDSSNGYIDFKYQDGEDDEGNTEYKYQRYEYNGSKDYLQYAWSNNETSNLRENLTPLAGPVNSLIFKCYKELEQPASIPDEIDRIREVHIKMITYDDQGKADPIPLSTRVYLRTWIARYVTDNFAIFGDDGVGIGDQPIYIGYSFDPSNVGANEDITVGNHTTINGEIHHAAGGDLIAKDTDVHLGPDHGYDEYIMMPCVTDFSDSVWWEGVYPSTSQGEVKVEHDEELSLAPGIYDDLNMANNSKLNLSSGTYYFSSITAANGVRLNMDTTGGDIRVFVDGTCMFGNMLSIEGGDARNIYFETHYEQDYDAKPADDPAWSMGQNTSWIGAVYAPYGDIDVTDGVITGQLISGGSVNIHGGNPSQINTPMNATIVDFALSEHIYDNGYACE